MVKFTATGDSLILERLAPSHKGFAKVSEFIKKGDVRITNLETVIDADECFANQYSGGAWLNSPLGVLNDLTAYGFNLFACANNHAMDYSYGGLMSTRKHLTERGIAYAGIGTSLEEASRPAFVNTDGGRVGMISLSDSIPRFAVSRANNSHDGIPSRPGLNPLRFSVEYNVTEEHMKILKCIAGEIEINKRAEVSRAQGFVKEVPEDIFDFGGIIMREGEKPGRISYVNETDMRRTERGIKSALLACEQVVVTIHSHQLKGGDETEADYFIEDFCHRCIDAGAAAVVGTGTHLLKGIEIYKGRPIFYSLGNFIFTLDTITRQPEEALEDFGFPLEMTGSEAMSLRTAGHTKGIESQPIYYRSFIPYWEIEDGVLKKLTLLPIELGFKKPSGFCGFPSASAPEIIYEHLVKVSEPYGTKFKISGDLIEVVI